MNSGSNRQTEGGGDVPQSSSACFSPSLFPRAVEKRKEAREEAKEGGKEGKDGHDLLPTPSLIFFFFPFLLLSLLN